MAILKLCHCGKPISAALTMCETCQGKYKDRHTMYDKYARDKDSTSFYKSAAWINKRKEALIRDHGLCQHCLKNKKITKADMVDHIIPIKVNWSLRLNINNLQSLCNSCHNAKTAADKKKYKGEGRVKKF